MSHSSIGKKILHFPLTKIIAGLVVCVGLVTLTQEMIRPVLVSSDLPVGLRRLILNAVVSLVALGAYWLLYRFYEKRRITELSFKRLGRNVGMGLLLGFVLQSLTILVIYLAGGYAVLDINPVHFLIVPFAAGLYAGIVEEVLFRGILFRIMEEKTGSYLALGISALIFGGLHLANPNSSIFMALAIAIQAGLLLGAAYILTRNLWFPIAIHFAWNFTQSGIYGASTSGTTTTYTLLSSQIEAHPLITGGAFGPEGSLQATAFCLVATIGLLIMSHRRNQIIPFPRRKANSRLPVVEGETWRVGEGETWRGGEKR